MVPEGVNDCDEEDSWHLLSVKKNESEMMKQSNEISFVSQHGAKIKSFRNELSHLLPDADCPSFIQDVDDMKICSERPVRVGLPNEEDP